MVFIISVDHGCVATMQICFVHRLILGFQGFLVLHWTHLAAMSTDDALDPNLVIAHGRALMLVRRYFSSPARRVFFFMCSTIKCLGNTGIRSLHHPHAVLLCSVLFSISQARSLTKWLHNKIKVTWMHVMLCQLYDGLHLVTRTFLARLLKYLFLIFWPLY